MTTSYTPVPEILVIDGKKSQLFLYPPVPTDHPRIAEGDEIRAALMVGGRHWCRGYQGTWEIRSGRLYLKDLKGRIRLKAGRPVLANWFSGALRVPKRRVDEYVRTGFAVVHRGRALMAFEKGVAVPAERIGSYRLPDIYQVATTTERITVIDASSRLRTALARAASAGRKCAVTPPVAKKRVPAKRKRSS